MDHDSDSSGHTKKQDLTRFSFSPRGFLHLLRLGDMDADENCSQQVESNSSSHSNAAQPAAVRPAVIPNCF